MDSGAIFPEINAGVSTGQGTDICPMRNRRPTFPINVFTNLDVIETKLEENTGGNTDSRKKIVFDIA